MQSENTVGGIFDKVQLTKLLINTLKDLGYNTSAKSLQQESGGIQIESNGVQKLFTYIKLGQYETIDFDMLNALSLRQNSSYNHGDIEHTPVNVKTMNINNIISRDLNTVAIIDNFEIQYNIFDQYYNETDFDMDILGRFRNVLEIMILINKQFFLELIYEIKDIPTAVIFLRTVVRKYLTLWDTVLSGLQTNIIDEEMIFTPDKILRELSSILTMPEAHQDIPGSTSWSGSVTESRQTLIERIAFYINPNDLVPQGRLIELLKQAIKYQRSCNISTVFDEDNTLDNEKDQHVSLLQNNLSDFERINFSEQKAISANRNEIWYLEFSPNGRYLAAAIANVIHGRKVLIYDVQNDFKILKILKGNDQSILFLSFSDDSRYLVSCSFNENTNIYDLESHGEVVEINNEYQVVPSEAPRMREVDFNGKKRLEETVETEIIEPFDSFAIPAKKLEVKESSSSNTPSTSAAPESTTSSHGTTDNIEEKKERSLRSWCCDWFHTEKHKGKLIVGSPDRDVVIYDTNTRSIIYKWSQNWTIRRVKTGNFNNGRDEFTNFSESTIASVFYSSADYADYLKEEDFPRIHSLKISYDDKYLLLMTHVGTIMVFNISTLPTNEEMKSMDPPNIINHIFKLENKLKVGNNITCISLPARNCPNTNKLSSLVLVNVQKNELQLWDYKQNVMIQKYYGQKQQEFIIRSCFGLDNKLVVSGSEDGKVYVWDLLKGNIVGILLGHVKELAPTRHFHLFLTRENKNCNVVAWNPTNKYMFASGGDDGLIKIWKVTID
ncbi:hypothetical protein C6P45_004820 [Maudiozyma exigua]|uniref:WD40 repeat-like protein n=1 Tax=Maudiozyma exigua TaxID=34358 RepID=A0A9P6WC46_MAUEX|nr:hypothetical protein C6P45_004820 [Kazachstania exigua]